MTFDGKVVLITGAGTGLGRELARALLERKARVVLNDLDEFVYAVQEELKGAFAIPADVSNEQEVRRLYENLYDEYGCLDVAICNAGIGLSKPLIETTLDDFDQVINVNLKGTYLCNREALKFMGHQKQGTLINISSGSIRTQGYPHLGIYCASKAGVEALTKCVAREYEHVSNLRVYGVLPGRMNTKLHQKMFPGFPEEKLLNPSFVAEEIVKQLLGEPRPETGKLIEIYK